MSTNIFEGAGLQVTRFACGKCRTEGPCFQITGDGSGGGDFVIVHRAQAHDAAYAILHDMHKPASPYADPCVDDQHRGRECRCCHAIMHCCSHHCCCFYRCKTCHHAKEEHVSLEKCVFGDCACKAYLGE